MDIALATCRRLPEPDPDAAPLARALKGAGIRATTLAWDDPRSEWEGARLTVLRSTWNYPLDRPGFLRWAEEVAAVSELWNPLPVVRWNSHKSYLLDLERAGVPVTPTELVPRGSTESLAGIRERRGWERVVVKPAVSAASYRTLRVEPESRPEGERHLAALAADGDVLVQPYLEAVEGYGERAVVWVDGEVTHAVRKTPRFSGEDESVSEALPVSAVEADVARRALAVVEEPLLYGRVDMAPGPNGDPVVMELELVEPSLFFPQCPEALDRFVAALGRLLYGNGDRAGS